MREQIIVRLSPITVEIIDACIDLSIAKDQQDYVADNLYSIAQTHIRQKMEPLAIYTSYVAGNAGAKCLYEGLGFKPTGVAHNHEVEMELVLDSLS